jgi:acyl dehydratase
MAEASRHFSCGSGFPAAKIGLRASPDKGQPMDFAGFKTPVEERCFEDYVPGSVHEFGRIEIDETEIIFFARQFDPQLFHTDPEGAKSTIYGGLIASGWHTASLMMRECVRYYLPRAASLGSPGVDELSWNLPVRPGDTLTVRVTVLEANRSRSKPDRGIVTSLWEVLNQDRKVAMSLKAVNFILCRSSNEGLGTGLKY